MEADWYLIGRIALAAGLGYGVGWERSIRGHAAGERTFALLALGAASFTAVVVDQSGGDGLSRTVQGIAAGVGFIGAAITWRDGSGKQGTRGLTTAASVWSVASMGALCGSGKLLVAGAVAVLTLLLLELRYLPVLSIADPRRYRERYQDDDEAG